MEAGYDWILVRSHLRHRFVRLFSIALIVVGAVMVSGGAVYYGYAAYAHRQLTALGAPIPLRVMEPTLDHMLPDFAVEILPSTALTLTQALPALRLYPGEVVPPRYWGSTASYEPVAVQQAALIDGFKPADTRSAAPVGALLPAQRIMIPSINLSSPIKELAVLDLGDARAYETPKQIVGHIPESASSGEAGTGWYFGHLESPIRGEGAIFRSLPEIPNLLRQGQDVFVVLEGSNGVQFLYRVFNHEVIPQDSLVMNDLGRSTIALVTCVPPLVYDHRLVVWAELVGQK